ncbi:hypothetical protein P691DRAFT_784445 [Macrolepiota fuliginosa MF-IS2]|uniref:CFEM domain-containing protein n=1 Tax=Macrolepiota fuliginosa MF-IS2 TaxID=1400762 RepID=A0A9P5X9W7_9AGAR|nr:hypothetical protein P691DRAFT_784445 [Macrolepiota fuliginosa MF-IS2]
MLLFAIAFAMPQDTTTTPITSSPDDDTPIAPTASSPDDDITTAAIHHVPKGNRTSTLIPLAPAQNATTTPVFAPPQNATITTTTARPTKSHNVPTCVYQCLVQAAQYSGCSMYACPTQNDKSCACSNMDFQQITHSCVAANCTLAEQTSITSIEQKCAGATRVAGSRTANLAATSATSAAIQNGGHVGNVQELPGLPDPGPPI